MGKCIFYNSFAGVIAPEIVKKMSVWSYNYIMVSDFL
jgi:hypothetical protein